MSQIWLCQCSGQSARAPNLGVRKGENQGVRTLTAVCPTPFVWAGGLGPLSSFLSVSAQLSSRTFPPVPLPISLWGQFCSPVCQTAFLRLSGASSRSC